MEQVVFNYKGESAQDVYAKNTVTAENKKRDEFEELICKMFKKFIEENYNTFAQHLKIRKPAMPFRLGGKLNKNLSRKQSLIYKT